MLLKIDVNPEDILYNEGGRIVIRVKYYAEYAKAAHLITTEGQTMEDFAGDPGRANKSLFVGTRGGLSLE